MKGINFYIAFIFLLSCSSQKQPNGIYHATLEIDQKTLLPLIMEFENGRMLSPDSDTNHQWQLTAEKDSIIIKSAVYESEFHLGFKGDDLSGFWYNKQKGDYKMSCSASKSDLFMRLMIMSFDKQKSNSSFNGKWQVEFDPEDPYSAIGEFRHEDDSPELYGTFMTETGDYRDLSGFRYGNNLYLSTFDGAHAFLFTADLENDTLKGKFYSGKHWSTDWIAVRNDSASLGDPYKLTKQDSVFALDDLLFENIHNETTHRMADSMYYNKPVMIQIMGTWCPNCYDETRYYNQLYKEYADKGLEITAVCFESQDKAEAKKRIMKYKEAMEVEYSMVYGGKLAKTNASAAFPFLNEVISYPTTLFFNRDHELVKIHTGFNGPATGKVYETYKSEMDELMKTLLSHSE